jgi:hypothetical protein
VSYHELHQKAREAKARRMCAHCFVRPAELNLKGAISTRCRRCRIAADEYMRRRYMRSYRGCRSDDFVLIEKHTRRIEAKRSQRNAKRHVAAYEDILTACARERPRRVCVAISRQDWLAYDSFLGLVLQGAGFERDCGTAEDYPDNFNRTVRK